MIRELWLGASLILAIFFYIIVIFFLKQAKQSSELISLKKYSIGIAVFMAILGCNGFIDFGAMYYTEVLGEYDLFPESLQLLTAGQTSFYIIISLLMIGFAILSYQIEKYIKQSKRWILTTILIICFIISLIPYFGGLIPTEYHQIVKNIVYGTQIPFFFIIIYWGVFYLALAKNTTGIVRRRAVMVAFGLGFLFAGIIVDTIYRWLTDGLYFFPFILKCISITGAVLLMLGFKRESM
ncbi:MAG: hypothetical protein ACTSRZ_19385 [Promethearchaeota archaeon]